LPIIKRLPRKRGFHNPFRVAYSPVNLDALSIFAAGTEILCRFWNTCK
jgi:large subunit ribosomal protein L15